MNEHATIEEAMFSMESAPMLYNEALTQLELELSRVRELAVAVENSESLRGWQNNCEEMARKELHCAAVTVRLL
jgi:hypothetical protein